MFFHDLEAFLTGDFEGPSVQDFTEDPGIPEASAGHHDIVTAALAGEPFRVFRMEDSAVGHHGDGNALPDRANDLRMNGPGVDLLRKPPVDGEPLHAKGFQHTRHLQGGGGILLIQDPHLHSKASGPFPAEGLHALPGQGGLPHEGGARLPFLDLLDRAPHVEIQHIEVPWAIPEDARGLPNVPGNAPQQLHLKILFLPAAPQNGFAVGVSVNQRPRVDQCRSAVIQSIEPADSAERQVRITGHGRQEWSDGGHVF